MGMPAAESRRVQLTSIHQSKAGLIVHSFGLMNASKFDRAVISPHGIPVAAPTCGRRVRGGEPNEDETGAGEASDERYAAGEKGALTRRPGRRC